MKDPQPNPPTGTGCAVYQGAAGPLVFLSPRAADLPARAQADLLRAAARALTDEARYRDRPGGRGSVARTADPRRG